MPGKKLYKKLLKVTKLDVNIKISLLYVGLVLEQF